MVAAVLDAPTGAAIMIKWSAVRSRDGRSPMASFGYKALPDVVGAARAGQNTSDSYDIQRMLKRVLTSKRQVPLCGICMGAQMSAVLARPK